jgi:hypothetical protein
LRKLIIQGSSSTPIVFHLDATSKIELQIDTEEARGMLELSGDAYGWRFCLKSATGPELQGAFDCFTGQVGKLVLFQSVAKEMEVVFEEMDEGDSQHQQ